jgi:pentatricopeptide repeat protein
MGISYNNICCVLLQQGKIDEALELYERLLSITLASLPKNHPDIGGGELTTLNLIQPLLHLISRIPDE